MCRRVGVVGMSVLSACRRQRVGTLGMSACRHVGVGWQRELGASEVEGMNAAAILAVDSWV